MQSVPGASDFVGASHVGAFTFLELLVSGGFADHPPLQLEYRPPYWVDDALTQECNDPIVLARVQTFRALSESRLGEFTGASRSKAISTYEPLPTPVHKRRKHTAPTKKATETEPRSILHRGRASLHLPRQPSTFMSDNVTEGGNESTPPRIEHEMTVEPPSTRQKSMECMVSFHHEAVAVLEKQMVTNAIAKRRHQSGAATTPASRLMPIRLYNSGGTDTFNIPPSASGLHCPSSHGVSFQSQAVAPFLPGMTAEEAENNRKVSRRAAADKVESLLEGHDDGTHLFSSTQARLVHLQASAFHRQRDAAELNATVHKLTEHDALPSGGTMCDIGLLTSGEIVYGSRAALILASEEANKFSREADYAESVELERHKLMSYMTVAAWNRVPCCDEEAKWLPKTPSGTCCHCHHQSAMVLPIGDGENELRITDVDSSDTNPQTRWKVEMRGPNCDGKMKQCDLNVLRAAETTAQTAWDMCFLCAQSATRLSREDESGRGNGPGFTQLTDDDALQGQELLQCWGCWVLVHPACSGSLCATRVCKNLRKDWKCNLCTENRVSKQGGGVFLRQLERAQEANTRIAFDTLTNMVARLTEPEIEDIRDAVGNAPDLTRPIRDSDNDEKDKEQVLKLFKKLCRSSRYANDAMVCYMKRQLIPSRYITVGDEADMHVEYSAWKHAKLDASDIDRLNMWRVWYVDAVFTSMAWQDVYNLELMQQWKTGEFWSVRMPVGAERLRRAGLRYLACGNFPNRASGAEFVGWDRLRHPGPGQGDAWMGEVQSIDEGYAAQRSLGYVGYSPQFGGLTDDACERCTTIASTVEGTRTRETYDAAVEKQACLLPDSRHHLGCGWAQPIYGGPRILQISDAVQVCLVEIGYLVSAVEFVYALCSVEHGEEIWSRFEGSNVFPPVNVGDDIIEALSGLTKGKMPGVARQALKEAVQDHWIQLNITEMIQRVSQGHEMVLKQWSKGRQEEALSKADEQSSWHEAMDRGANSHSNPYFCTAESEAKLSNSNEKPPSSYQCCEQSGRWTKNTCTWHPHCPESEFTTWDSSAGHCDVDRHYLQSLAGVAEELREEAVFTLFAAGFEWGEEVMADVLAVPPGVAALRGPTRTSVRHGHTGRFIHSKLSPMYLNEWQVTLMQREKEKRRHAERVATRKIEDPQSTGYLDLDFDETVDPAPAMTLRIKAMDAKGPKPEAEAGQNKRSRE